MGQFLRHTNLVLGRHIRASLRDPGFAYITPTIIPLAIIGVISQEFRATADIPGFPTAEYVDWMMPGMVVMTGMFGGGVMAVRMVGDHNAGYLDRLRLLPISSAAILTGTALFDAFRTVIPAVAVLIAGISLGAPLEAGPAGAVGLILTALLWSVTWNSVFMVVGLRTRSEQAAQALLPLFLPIWWTSSVLIPEDLMPGWIQGISSINPISLLVDAVRPLALGGDVNPSTVALGLGVSLALLLLLQMLTASLFVRLGSAT